MRKLLVVGAAIVALGAASANAADLRVKAPVYKAPPPPVWSWTGCYIGAHVGGLWAHKDWTLQPPDPIVGLGSHDANSVLGGIQAGCDYQFAGGWVIGIQGDYAWTDAKGSHFDVVDGVIDQTRVRSLATVTGRVGYAGGRFLGYVKGGGAWERDNYDRFAAPGAFLVGSARETRGGWTIGVGGEYAFMDWPLSAFLEYNYYDFGNRTLTFVDPAGGFNDNI